MAGWFIGGAHLPNQALVRWLPEHRQSTCSEHNHAQPDAMGGGNTLDPYKFHGALHHRSSRFMAPYLHMAWNGAKWLKVTWLWQWTSVDSALFAQGTNVGNWKWLARAYKSDLHWYCISCYSDRNLRLPIILNSEFGHLQQLPALCQTFTERFPLFLG